MLRVLVIDESQERAGELCAGLALSGYQVVALLPSSADLHDRVEAISPDVILIQTDSPSRDTLEHLAMLNADLPRPVVMFAKDHNSRQIRRAIKAGVSAYVVDGLATHRLQPVIEVAIARFEEHLQLRTERDRATRKLADRVVIDRAKGVLMKARGFDEEGAYQALRKMAMDRGQPLRDVAANVLEMAQLLL
ncbi:ANTAR domain-containing response regulator [Denitratisoma oestradiolicum]|uniref:Putative response regulator antiterminator n=1 Tax=Denitratisoma oestradiolicum TaxID=311182 RepID=A0A6S6XV26_9PROT|nr:ANTAR domain-containing protein [Denitratisoma oestradiolicum]TWO79580.1 response regulator [Denitratisoma oestradiolicum]CAB1368023.1 putative response regulator antiterminator [Denitratisoma oestradiolicum]